MTHNAENDADLTEYRERVAEELCAALHSRVGEAFRMDGYAAHCSSCAAQADALLAPGGVVAGIAAEAKRAEHEDPLHALLAQAKAEALRSQRDFFLAVDMPVAADHCEQAAIGWDHSRAIALDTRPTP